MVLLHFKITVAPDHTVEWSWLSSELKRCIELCDITVKTFEILKVQSGESSKPEVKELVIDVQGEKIAALQHLNILSLYREFSERWMSVTEKFPPEKRPLLTFTENKSFGSVCYSGHTDIVLNYVSFGVQPFSGQYVCYKTLKASSWPGFRCVNFYHDTKTIEINLIELYESYIMKISYNDIRKIVIKKGGVFEIFLDLANPPLFQLIKKNRSRHIGEYSIYHRVCDVGIDISVIGKANVIRLVLNNSLEGEEIVSRIHFRCGCLPIHYVNMNVISKVIPKTPAIHFPHFGSTYMLTAIFNRSFTFIEQCVNLFNTIDILTRYATENGDCLEKALTDVLFTLDSGKIVDFLQSIHIFYKWYIDNEQEENFSHYVIPEKSRFIRRVIITPTRILLWPPEIMFENRVLRNFDPDFALRVNFRNDNMSKLNYIASYASDDIFTNAIIKPMTNGIVIGKRTYKFLAWSNSQIRDHGVWMYARDSNGIEVSNIRSWMGDFSHIHIVPKYMARMGQCFSQTEDTVAVPLNKNCIRTDSDIEGGLDPLTFKPYCFSDGIGKISVKLANVVKNILGHDKYCSAFQIRYGGYKGMLVIDPTLTAVDIVFRNSMKKFESPKNIKLEIARTSSPVPLQLNRPFITILNQMGVNPRIFLQLQEDMLRMLTDMLLDEKKAASYLTAKTPSGLYKYSDMAASGIGLTTEPFFRSMLLALHRHHVDAIKTKANIAIDPKEGRNMLGVLDETGILEYGQVFVQYTTDILAGETKKDATILEGPVLVTKNPCVYPGDVRMFNAVDIPQLHHIIDCIVFPQKGNRPHPSEMAGSDLDGDEYAVLWKRELLFIQPNYNPAHFPSISAPEVCSIQDKDMINFLCEYIKNDQIGVISSAHLAHADNEGISSLMCLRIAKKCSIAVDFAKTGGKAHLDISEKPDKYPDFMEKYWADTYKSRRALGKLYRVCKDFETENEAARNQYSNVQVDKNLIYPGWEKYEEDAEKSKSKYNNLLKSVLQLYGIQHESEAFSRAFTHLHWRHQGRNDKAEIEKVIIGSLKALCKNMKNEFLAEFLTDSGCIQEQQTAILQKASAWYIVTYRNKDADLLSFPWIVSGYLANIGIRKQCELNSMNIVYSPIVLNLESIVNCELSMGILPPLPPKAVPLLNNYIYFCNRQIIETALRTIIMWAAKVHIIQNPGARFRRGFLFIETFVLLFLHVAELEQYVSKTASQKNANLNFTSAALCLAFLRFCVTLRFYNKNEVTKFLPFMVYDYRKLSKCAMLAYHSIALSGHFQSLGFDPQKYSEEVIEIEMNPFTIPSRLFSSVTSSSTKNVEQILVNHSGVKDIQLRFTGKKKVMISARGSSSSIQILKMILRKNDYVLRHLFATGEMPETSPPI